MAPRLPKQYYTLAEGVPLPRNDTTVQLRNQEGGGLSLLQDTQLIETLAHFSRERIPERVVHAKAAGAHGYLEITHDISDITDADFLNGVGKKTELLTCISTVGPERGSADTVREFRGWATKFKTAEDGFWDFHINNQESIHGLMFLFGDRGIPANLTNQHGYGGHTYKFTKRDGSFHYVKIHLISNEGVNFLTNAQAPEIAGKKPDFHVLGLFERIASGDFPSWTVAIQTMHPSEVSKSLVNIFDMTKVWPHSTYPLRTVGRMVLNMNPKNYFAEIEQAAFSPSSMVPGIEPSADPMLQARMFAYPDASRYRIGTNYQFLPTNAAKSGVYCPTQRHGSINFTNNYGGDPYYLKSGIKRTQFKQQFSNGVKNPMTGYNDMKITSGGRYETWSSHVTVFTSEVTDEDFDQPRALWNLMQKQQGAQDRFVENVAARIRECIEGWIREEAYNMFSKVDVGLGARIKDTTEVKLKHGRDELAKTAWH